MMFSYLRTKQTKQTKHADKEIISFLSTAIFKVVRFVVIFGLCFIILKPFIIKILAASMSPEDLLDSMVKTVPKNWSTYYWNIAYKGLNIESAGLWTLALSLVSGIVQVITSSMIGYGLARFNFKLRNFGFLLVIIIMLIPPDVYSVAQFLHFRFFSLGFFQINFMDTGIPIFILSLFGLGLKQGLYIYMMRSFFMCLPKNLEEAAYIDGASIYKTFVKVIVPNARTIMTTIFLFAFCWQWTDTSLTTLFFTKNILLISRPGDIFIKNSLSSLDVLGTAIVRNAAVMLIILPLIVLFAFFQKSLVKSISTSSQAN